MSDFLRELGYDPFRYWLLAGCTFLLWLASALVSPSAKGSLAARLNHPVVYCGLLLVTMIAWRWPALLHYKPVNPDESQFLAGAITMLAQRNLWWADAMTSGPLVVLPLTLPAALGLPIDFVTGRAVGLLLTWGMICFGYLTVRHIHGDRNARLLTSPLATAMILLLFWDFVPYCSERSPLFFCSLSIWLCYTAVDATGTVRSRWRLAAGGFAIGLLPFSKFQVMPLGAAIGLSTFVWILCQRGRPRAAILRDAATLIGGLLAGLALMFLSIWQSGHWPEVYEAYLVHNLYYTRARGLPWSESGYILTYLTEISWGFSTFHYGVLALLLVSLAGFHRTIWRPVLLAGSLLLATYSAVLTPGRLYPHYLLFLSLPLVLLTALLFGYFLERRSHLQRLLLWLLFLGVGVGVQLADRLWDRHSLHKLIEVPSPLDTVVQFLNTHKRQDDTLAVWGWKPELYVRTQLPQGIREALTEAQLSTNPQRDYFRQRVLSDLHSTTPAFIVDSVGPEDYLLKNRAEQGHEIIPGLGEFIAGGYVAVPLNDAYRVYVRKDRAMP